MLAHAGKSSRRAVPAFIATAFAQESAEAASLQWRAVADQIRPKGPKLAAIMDKAEHDVLAYMSFLKEHRVKLHSINPIERLNARSSGSPRSLASSQMTTPSSASSAPCCLNRMMNGPCSGPAT